MKGSSHAFVDIQGNTCKGKETHPIKWVQTMGEEAVYLHVTKDLVEELADASIIW